MIKEKTLTWLLPHWSEMWWEHPSYIKIKKRLYLNNSITGKQFKHLIRWIYHGVIYHLKEYRGRDERDSHFTNG